MKILIIAQTWPYPPHKDGTSLITYQIIKKLAHKHQLTLFYLRARNDEIKKDSVFDKVKTQEFYLTGKSLPTYYLSPMAIELPWGIYKYYSAELVKELKEIDQEKKFDLIFVASPFLANYLKPIKQTPKVINLVDDITSWFKQAAKKTKNPLKKIHLKREALLNEKIEAQCYPLANKCNLVSEKDRTALIKRGLKSDQVTAITNGVDLDYFKPKDAQLEDAIIFSGKMDYPPNQEAVLSFYQNTWPELKKQIPNIKWYIVGKDPQAKIKNLSQNDKQIIVTGFVDDIREYFYKAKVVVSPLLSGAGVKNKILEALALGKAIVASPKSMEGISASDGKEVLVAKDDYVKHIQDLFNNNELREKLEKNSRQFIENNYSWQKTISMYENLFEQATK